MLLPTTLQLEDWEIANRGKRHDLFCIQLAKPVETVVIANAFYWNRKQQGSIEKYCWKFFFSTKAAQEGWTHKYSGSFGPRPSQHQS